MQEVGKEVNGVSCKYKAYCPSRSGWCEGPQQYYDRCVPFLISAANRCIHESATQKEETDRWKLEAQKQAAAAGEIRITLAERLEAIRTDIAVSEQMLLCEDNEIDQVILGWKITQKKCEASWLESILYGKKG